MDALPKGLMGGDSFAGVVTLANWTMAPDGETYLYFWAPTWVIMTDKLIGQMVGQKEFRSAEKWSLLGYSAHREEPVIFLPGCGVKGWMSALACPQTRASSNSIFSL